MENLVPSACVKRAPRGIPAIGKKMTNPPRTPFDPKREPDRPLSLHDAVERVLDGLSEQDLRIIANLPEANLEDLNRYDLGSSVRKNFALWRGNRALMAACGALNPEDTSMEIIRAVWESVRGGKW